MGNVVYDECGIPNADVPSVVNGILNQYPQARIEVTPDPIDPVGKACIKAWA
jgi:hypothetical protein